MSYKKNLKRELRDKNAQLMAIVDGRHVNDISMNARQRVAQLNSEIRQIETQLARVNDQRNDTRGVTGRGNSTAEDREYTNFLRGKSGTEFRTVLDSNAMSTAPNSSGASAGATGYDGGYLIPQGFWQNLQIALKAYGGVSSSFRLVQTDSGNPMPWPTVDPTGIVGAYMTEMTQLGFGGDSAGTDYQFGF